MEENTKEQETPIQQDATEVLAEETAQEETPQEGESHGEKGFFGKKKSSAELKKLMDQLAEKETELSEMKDRYARLAAEFDNYKKRTSREMDARYSDAKGDVLKGFLPVLDNFGRAVATEVPKGCEPIQEGVTLIFQQFSDILKGYGVEEIEALGKEFDPNLHNAIMHVEDASLGENQVVEVFEKGYRMGDKVLRYSMVKVAN